MWITLSSSVYNLHRAAWAIVWRHTAWLSIGSAAVVCICFRLSSMTHGSAPVSVGGSPASSSTSCASAYSVWSPSLPL